MQSNTMKMLHCGEIAALRDVDRPVPTLVR